MTEHMYDLIYSYLAVRKMKLGANQTRFLRALRMRDIQKEMPRQKAYLTQKALELNNQKPLQRYYVDFPTSGELKLLQFAANGRQNENEKWPNHFPFYVTKNLLQATKRYHRRNFSAQTMKKKCRDAQNDMALARLCLLITQIKRWTT